MFNCSGCYFVSFIPALPNQKVSWLPENVCVAVSWEEPVMMSKDRYVCQTLRWVIDLITVFCLLNRDLHCSSGSQRATALSQDDRVNRKNRTHASSCSWHGFSHIRITQVFADTHTKSGWSEKHYVIYLLNISEKRAKRHPGQMCSWCQV